MKVPPGDSEETCEGEGRGREMGACQAESHALPVCAGRLCCRPGTAVPGVGRAPRVLVGGGEELHGLLVQSLHLWGPLTCQV